MELIYWSACLSIRRGGGDIVILVTTKYWVVIKFFIIIKTLQNLMYTFHTKLSIYNFFYFSLDKTSPWWHSRLYPDSGVGKTILNLTNR